VDLNIHSVEHQNKKKDEDEDETNLHISFRIEKKKPNFGVRVGGAGHALEGHALEECVHNQSVREELREKGGGRQSEKKNKYISEK